MKVLFICPDDYPNQGPCSNLLRKLFHEGNMLQTVGEIHVLSAKKKVQGLDYEIVGGVKVHRFASPMQWSKVQLLKMLPVHPVYAICGMMMKLLHKYILPFLGAETLFPAYMLAPYIKKLKALHGENYDLIIPMCGDFALAAAALEYLKEVDTKLIVYQVDPCATSAKYAGDWAQKAAAFERDLFERADAIVTTPICYSEMEAIYPQTIMQKSCKMEFPNVSVTDDIGCPDQDSAIRCVFSGSLYPLARNPQYTLKLFRAIENPAIQLHIIGADREAMAQFVDECEIGDNIVLHGRLSWEKAFDKICKADLLVNIGNIMTNQVPSKIFDYISARKPILNICVNENCPSIPYLERYPKSLTLVEGIGTVEEHAKAVERFITENAGYIADKEEILTAFYDCTADHCAKQLIAVLEKYIK